MRKLLNSNKSLYLFALAALVVSITGATGTPFVSADSQVGGIISEDTTWTAENSPYEITETVQIPSGVTLTIEPGVMISKPSSGDMFVLMGTIRAHGTSQKPIVIDGGGNSKIIYTQPGYGYGDFQYCIIQNGYDFWDRWGHLDLRYSELVNLGTGGNWGHSIIKLDGPSGESNIEFNKFISTGGIYSYSDHYGTNIRYNLFQGLLSPLAHMGGGTPSSPPKEMIVKYNSFVNTEELALYLESGFIGWSPSIDGDTVTYDIYFGTSETPPLKETIGPYLATQSLITYGLSMLVHHTTYYWKVIAKDNHGTEAESPVWEFTTAKEIVEYYLTVSSTAGGSVTEPGEGTFTYDEGVVVDLRVAVEESSRFVNWTGDVDTIADVTAAATNITIYGDYSITANFEEISLPPMNWQLIGGIIAGVVAVGLVIFFVRKRGRGQA